MPHSSGTGCSSGPLAVFARPKPGGQWERIGVCSSAQSGRMQRVSVSTPADCGGASKIIACIRGSAVINRILGHLKQKVVPGTA